MLILAKFSVKSLLQFIQKTSSNFSDFIQMVICPKNKVLYSFSAFNKLIAYYFLKISCFLSENLPLLHT